MIINGKEISKNIINKLKEKDCLRKKAPKLGVILVGDNPASLTYVAEKELVKHVALTLSFILTTLKKQN